MGSSPIWVVPQSFCGSSAKAAPPSPAAQYVIIAVPAPLPSPQNTFSRAAAAAGEEPKRSQQPALPPGRAPGAASNSLSRGPPQPPPCQRAARPARRHHGPSQAPPSPVPPPSPSFPRGSCASAPGPVSLTGGREAAGAGVALAAADAAVWRVSVPGCLTGAGGRAVSCPPGAAGLIPGRP